MPDSRRTDPVPCRLMMLPFLLPFQFSLFLATSGSSGRFGNYLHWADLPSLWAGGWTAGRTSPLEVWGPSGAREDMGKQ